MDEVIHQDVMPWSNVCGKDMHLRTSWLFTWQGRTVSWVVVICKMICQLSAEE